MDERVTLVEADAGALIRGFGDAIYYVAHDLGRAERQSEAGFAARIAQAGCDVFLVDLVGRGRGPNWSGVRRTGIGDYVDEVAAAIEGIGKPPVVVGHSKAARILRRTLMRSASPIAVAVQVAPVPRGGMAPLAIKVLRDDPWAALRTHATLSLWPAVSTADRTRRFSSVRDAARTG